ncbi:Transfer protein [Seminavis robusta]|uniref:Transfer protein n=1 Tax=Seminavis robusta TaxID=568900 RepID=A0A9N8DGI7_9STRA|nr:Transfer protein [Seminavis robusta]|eukprot:Sro147_g067860.1 Transfer protein (567) ;mRNA; f:56319-58110
MKNASQENAMADTITDLLPHDVLLGRGLGSSQYQGNKAFLEVVEQYKASYNQTLSYKEKKSIAKEVFGIIQSRGGRFLKLLNYQKGARNVVQEGAWCLANVDEALEKCKQALRQQRDKPTQKLSSSSRTASSGSSDGTQREQKEEQSSAVAQSEGCKVSGHGFKPEEGSASVVVNESATTQGDDQVPNFALVGDAQGVSLQQASGSCFTVSPFSDMPNSLLVEDVPPDERSSPPSEPEDIDTTLAKLVVDGLPTFTKDQELKERASLTDVEKDEAMSDVFGKLHVSEPGKRAKRDFDNESKHALLREMRQELEQIPKVRKQALERAQGSCDSSEFSDERLSRFLRVEGYNPTLAAQRFVRYWEGRLEVFGPDKFLMPMTLAGAFQEDHNAIEDCVQCILPYPDSFGRPIVFADPTRRRPDRYSSQSGLRALWYGMEVLSRDHDSATFVVLCWVKHATIWDFDRYVYCRFPYYQNDFFPFRRAASHDCCADKLGVTLFRPVDMIVHDKASRMRRMHHCVPESEIVAVLKAYGIERWMLPLEMGGTLEDVQRKWVAQRRALEHSAKPI